MNIYICSSFKNSIINNEIDKELTELGAIVYLPMRDTSQNNFYRENLEAIEDAEVIIAVIDYTGKDFCFELGFARALRKIIVPVYSVPTEVDRRSMITSLLENKMTLEEAKRFLHILLSI